MNKEIYFFITLLVLSRCVSAQIPPKSNPSFYTHEFSAKIVEVDTIQLVDDIYTNNSPMPADNFKAVYVKLKIISKIKGNFKRAPKAIIIELSKNEHSCLFSLKQLQIYKIYAYTFHYSSDLIKKKYRKNFFKIDCYNPPSVIE